MRHPLDRVVVVGSSVAGITTAETLRRRGYGGRITLIGEEHHLPYDRPPLSKQVLDGSWTADRATIRGRSDLEGLDLDLRLGARAVALDLQACAVATADGDRVDFDRLVLATGVTARRLPTGHELMGVHLLRTVDDALALRAELTPGRRLVVIGAGFLGCEVAASARRSGLGVTVVDSLAVPMMRQLGPEVGALVAQVHRDRGVDVRCGVGVHRLVGDQSVTGVELSSGEVLAADVVLVAIGSMPATDWLTGSGLTVDDGIVCDALCSAAPGVYAAGDVARWWHERLGAYVRVEHRMNATEQAIAVAENLLGARTAFTPVPYFWTNQYDVRIQAYGTFPAGSRVVVTAGGHEDGRFIARYVTDDCVTGVLSWNMPRELRAERALVGTPV